MNNYFENRKELLNSLDDNSLVILYSGALKHRSADSSYPFVVNMKNIYLSMKTIQSKSVGLARIYTKMKLEKYQM